MKISASTLLSPSIDVIGQQQANRSSWHHGTPGVRQVGIAARFIKPPRSEIIPPIEDQLVYPPNAIGQNGLRNNSTQHHVTVQQPIRMGRVVPGEIGISVEDSESNSDSDNAQQHSVGIAEVHSRHLTTFFASQQRELPQPDLAPIPVDSSTTRIQRNSPITTSKASRSSCNVSPIPRSCCACCTVDNLDDRLSWYYGPMGQEEAQITLRHADVGTFLLRDSSQRPTYPYSLTVMTPRGVTSIRIAYTDGKYVLDADPSTSGGKKSPSMASSPSGVMDKKRTLSADCVIGLVERLMAMNSVTSEQAAGSTKKDGVRPRHVSSDGKKQKCVLLEHTGRADVELVVSKPLIGRVTSLKALCCVTISKQLHNNNRFDTKEMSILSDALGLNYHPHSI